VSRCSWRPPSGVPPRTPHQGALPPRRFAPHPRPLGSRTSPPTRPKARAALESRGRADARPRGVHSAGEAARLKRRTDRGHRELSVASGPVARCRRNVSRWSRGTSRRRPGRTLPRRPTRIQCLTVSTDTPARAAQSSSVSMPLVVMHWTLTHAHQLHQGKCTNGIPVRTEPGAKPRFPLAFGRAVEIAPVSALSPSPALSR